MNSYTQQLNESLEKILSKLNPQHHIRNDPSPLIQTIKNVESLFDRYSKSTPSQKDAYQVALKLLNEIKLDFRELDVVAGALSFPILEKNEICILETDFLSELLDKYLELLVDKNLRRLTWYALFISYLTAREDLARLNNKNSGFEKLRLFLQDSFHKLVLQNKNALKTKWEKQLDQNLEVLSKEPAAKFTPSILEGNLIPLNEFALELGIPVSSWFWKRLVLDTVVKATRLKEKEFKSVIELLIGLIKLVPFYRDEAIKTILEHYSEFDITEVHVKLRDYVIQPDVWKNPKLKNIGTAPLWDWVNEKTWKMVNSWVNERNLKVFFEILAARGNDDKGRLEFWSRYINQITTTRLVFSGQTLMSTDAEVMELLKSEDQAYARNIGKNNIDAFLMQIGKFVFVEFSVHGNGGYGYPITNIPFDFYAKTYRGSTDYNDLKSGYRDNNYENIRIRHFEGWQSKLTDVLRSNGIYPDQPKSRALDLRVEITPEQENAISQLKNLLTPK